MTDVIVDSIVSKRDFGTIFAGRLADGSSVRVKATNADMLGEPSVGELWSVDGDLSDTQWGPQISARRAVRALPSGKLMVDYLAGCVAGIGPTRARRLWQHFEDRLPEALDTGDVAALAAVMDPDRPVLGPRLAAALVVAWKTMAGEARLVEWLAAVGVTELALARRVHTLLGADAPRALQANPYCLVPLLDWKRVDALGLRLLNESGEADPVSHPHRLVGAADAVIKDLIGAGSTAIARDEFRERLAAMLGKPPPSGALDRAVELAIARQAVIVAPSVLLRAPGCALMEDGIITRLRAMANEVPPDRLNRLLDDLGGQGAVLTQDQAEAVRRSLYAGFSCLRGGAGTGKTFVTRTICDLWERAGGKLLLAALAGKAALRLSRSTGRLARTIFRTLRELDEREAIESQLTGDFEQSERAELEAKLRDLAQLTPDTLVILDEASMVDLPSLHGLLRRMPQGARLLLVGDERQLPPVGFGLLFHRFVEDPAVTSTLTTVHRQAATTSIPEVAAQIRRREMPRLTAYVGPHAGVMLSRASGRDEIAEKAVSIWNELREGRDVMIVTPVNDGPCGVSGLNRCLHDEYLRRKDLQELRGPLGDLFSPGEPVVHRRNCYKRGLFNGSMGVVRRIDRSERQLVAVFDDEEHVFAAEDLVDLSLGYALTCHRAQGSEADNVIVALPPSRLLDPSWLYTAITRARQQVIIIGNSETVKEALQRPYADECRMVGLSWT
ncbi:AAA family ATPase [Bradyrhizobium sp. LMG 9283]|uniref:AAA family ATPase n=1 Tax=Bradyrhizobium sp. LMG 9283 TaxID=592064 RepID=UPI00388DB33E